MAEEGVPVNQWEMWALPGCHREFSAPGADKQPKEEVLKSTLQTDRLAAGGVGITHCVMLRKYIRRWYRTFYGLFREVRNGKDQGGLGRSKCAKVKAKGAVSVWTMAVSTHVWLCPVPGQHCLAWPLIKLHSLYLFSWYRDCVFWGHGAAAASPLVSSLIHQPVAINMYMFIDVCICIYMSIYVSHSSACEYSCHSVAFFTWKEGRKLQIRVIWESQSAISVDTKDLLTQLSYLFSRKMASKDISSNFFQEGQTHVVLQKAKKPHSASLEADLLYGL